MLSPYRVLDLTDAKGLLCGKFLADLGAEVIKIEPPEGDSGRKLGPFVDDDPAPEKSLFWLAHNTGKKGITLDIAAERGREIFLNLVKEADIVIESFRPGYLDGLGLGYRDLSRVNSNLILTSITPFGQSGPYREFVGHDLVVWALSGLMNQTGDPDRPPLQVSLPQSFIAAATYAAEGTLVALFARHNIGRGQHVDVSALETVALLGMEALPFWLTQGTNMKRSGPAISRMGINAPVIWPAQDGYVSYILQMGLPGGDRNTRMAAWLDEEGLADDFIRDTDWYKLDFLELARGGMERLTVPLSRLFAAHTTKDLFDQGLERGISIYQVADSKDTLENEQLADRKFWVSLEHEELSREITYPGPFAVLTETPIVIDRRAPLIGEHNDEVYQALSGLSAGDLDQLKQAGII